MTIPAPILPVVRRAIIDLLDDIGSQQNDDVISRLLVSLGHRIARRDVVEQLQWLAEMGLAETEQIGPYLAAEILPDGSDVAAGRLRVDGISRYKTGR